MKKVIGYTTGVFDLFHIGHVNILKNAKANCDYLIVGVTTDEKVLELKKKEVVIPYEERSEIVRSIGFVDKVVPETTTNKLEAWESLKFDRIFKGDDWKGTDIWCNYEKEFAKRGVEVMYFKYTPGTSSSILKETLKSINNS